MKKPAKPISYLPAGTSSRLSFLLPNKEEKYRAVVENSIHAFFLSFPDGAILEINNTACKIFVQQSSEGIWRVELKEAIHISTPLEEMIDYCYHNVHEAECNNTFARMYGFEKSDDIIGIPLNRIMPDNKPENMGYLSKFFSNGFKVQNEISYETDKKLFEDAVKVTTWLAGNIVST